MERMMRLSVVAMVVVLLLSAGAVGIGGAQSGKVVTLDAQDEITEGNTDSGATLVASNVQDSDGVGSYEVELTYNDSALDLTVTGTSRFDVQTDRTTSGNTVRLTIVGYTSETTGSTGNITLADIEVTGTSVNSGATVSATVNDITDTDGNPLTHNGQDTTILVAEAADDDDDDDDGGGGGGGGGGVGGGDQADPNRVRTQIQAGGTATADFPAESSVSRTEVTIPNVGGSVTVESITDLPSGVPEPPGRQRAATVDISAPQPNEGTTATVRISVRSSAVPAGTSPSDLTISHYRDGEWVDLETTVVSSNGEIVLEAQTDRFSPFAVTYAQETATPEPGTDTPEPDTDTPEPGTDTPEPDTDTPEPDTGTPTSTPGFGFVVAILALLAAALLAVRRRAED